MHSNCLARLRYMACGAALVGVSITLSGAALAQERANDDDRAAKIETPEVMGKLFECRAITDPTARLACFDREVGAVQAAQESRELVIAERQQVEEARRGLFGLKLPSIRLFGGGDNEEVSELTATLASARKMGNGRFIFELDDGARWIQTESSPGYKKYKAGDTIVISKGALGSYKAKVEGKRAIRVRRLN